ncbi:MAG: OmpH family outer membrane protein [Tannerellaceae bacterium]|nr:OmpH family outer membrane protein [Tannerellaceae bacterium]
MKSINYVINGVLAVAIVILFILQFSGKKETSVTRTTFTPDENLSGVLPIAYVDMDSLLMNYNYYRDLSEVILKKEENSRANINQKANALRTEVQGFQRKLENNAFLTRERAAQEEQRLMNKQQELQELDNRLVQELMLEQQQLMSQLRDSLVAQLNLFNQNKGYQVILSNTGMDNILIAGDVYNITAELIEYLNRNYSAK